MKTKERKTTVLSIVHSVRFRQVSTRFPRRVWEAYQGHGGIRQASHDSDAQVAKRVAAWERRHGIPVRDWVAMGRKERGGFGYWDLPDPPELIAKMVARLLGAR